VEVTRAADKVEEKVEVVEAAQATDKVGQTSGTVTTTKKENSATTTANGIISVDGGRAATDCCTLQIRDVSATSRRSAAESAATTMDADQQQVHRQRYRTTGHRDKRGSGSDGCPRCH
jgi:hypothetical protein